MFSRKQCTQNLSCEILFRVRHIRTGMLPEKLEWVKFSRYVFTIHSKHHVKWRISPSHILVHVLLIISVLIKLTPSPFCSIAWTHDDKGFFYCRYPAPKLKAGEDKGTETESNLNMKVRAYVHVRLCMGVLRACVLCCFYAV